MRYQEAYELIDAGVIAGGIELPVSHNLIEIYFDQAIKEINNKLGSMASSHASDILQQWKEEDNEYV